MSERGSDLVGDLVFNISERIFSERNRRIEEWLASLGVTENAALSHSNCGCELYIPPEPARRKGVWQDCDAAFVPCVPHRYNLGLKERETLHFPDELACPKVSFHEPRTSRARYGTKSFQTPVMMGLEADDQDRFVEELRTALDQEARRRLASKPLYEPSLWAASYAAYEHLRRAYAIVATADRNFERMGIQFRVVDTVPEGEAWLILGDGTIAAVIKNTGMGGDE